MSEQLLIPGNPKDSPSWGSTLKLIVGLTAVVIAGALLVRFRNVVGPLLLAVITSYVLHPVAYWLSRRTRLSWRAAVNLIYLVVLIFVIGFITLTGVAVVQQAQNLVEATQRFLEISLPEIIENLSSRVYPVGPFTLDFSEFFGQVDTQAILQQIAGIIQPALGQVGGVLSTFASSTLRGLAWGFFILLVSYFILADAGQMPEFLSTITIPGHNEDFDRIGRRLGHIWRAFLRGQVFLFIVSSITFFILYSSLGLRNGLALALLAGAARFVPYIGPLISWTATAVVAFFQPDNYFNLVPIGYVLLVMGLAFLIDQVFDNLVTPRLYGRTLGVHPAGVLVAAIISANLIGFVGLLVAAPALASLNLISRYTFRKMFDLGPWPSNEEDPQSEIPGVPTLQRLWRRLRKKPAQGDFNELPERRT